MSLLRELFTGILASTVVHMTTSSVVATRVTTGLAATINPCLNRNARDHRSPSPSPLPDARKEHARGWSGCDGRARTAWIWPAELTGRRAKCGLPPPVRPCGSIPLHHRRVQGADAPRRWCTHLASALSSSIAFSRLRASSKVFLNFTF